MKYQFRKLNFWIVLWVDLLLLVAAHLLAYVIRFDGAVPHEQRVNISVVLGFLLPVKLILFQLFGLYRGMWRYTSLADLLNILKACVVAGFITLGGILLLNRFEGFSRSVFVLDGLLTFLFIAGFRISLRLSCQSGFCLPFLREDVSKRQRRKRLLIIGAGDAAEKVTREINDNKVLPYLVAGFLDDHAGKIGQQIQSMCLKPRPRRCLLPFPRQAVIRCRGLSSCAGLVEFRSRPCLGWGN
jgi:FlaA1/EpsC-like NDP-sugar epimerase